MNTPFTISVVCTGNICRSPMGEVILRDAVKAAGLGEDVEVESAGTGDWHVGGGADHRAEDVIARNRLSLAAHRVRQFQPDDFDRLDLVLALDHSHLRDLRRLARTDAQRDKIRLLRSFDAGAVAAGELDVNDPYYGDLQDFEITYDLITAAVSGILEFTQEALSSR